MLHAALANSKEHELQVTASRGEDVWGGPAVLLAPEQARPTRARIFPQKRLTNTNLIDHARPAGRPVGSACGFSSPSDAGQVRLEPTANGSRRETSLNHRHFINAHRYRMTLRAQGGFRWGSKTARLIDSSLVVCQRVQLLASRRAKQHCTRPTFRIADSSF